MSEFWKLKTAFKSDDRGAVAVIFAMSCVVLMLVSGMAVDSARYHDISNRMQQSLDGASLAAAKMLSDPNVSDAEITATALAYFQATLPTYGIDPSAFTTPVVSIDRTNATVEIAGRVNVPTLFGGFADLPSLTVINQKSKVVYDMTEVELAMVLDITGSMNTGNKLSDLKAAAKDVVDTLFDGALNDSSVRIAIAPYSASVNAGELAAAVSSAGAAAACPTKPKKGDPCMDAGGMAMDTCVLERSGAAAASDAAPVGSNALPVMSNPPFGNYSCPTSTVVPLLDRTERDTLKNNIDAYIATGSTAGHIGTAWGWYLLSPNWTGVLPAESAPKPYGSQTVQKNMIIMTDGEFNTSYTGATDESAESYAYFDNLCTGAKAAGITIYTVGFNLNVPEALAHLESCASSASSFYDAKNGNQLKDAFKDIANKLGNLRVAS